MAKKLIEKAQKSKFQYSAQAILHLNALDDNFDLDDFEKFCEKHLFIIGGNFFSNYLEYKAAESHKKRMEEGAKKTNIITPNKPKIIRDGF